MALNLPPEPNRCLAVLVRHPEPGKVKTRLARACGNHFAAELYGYFVDDLLEALAPGSYHLEIFFAPAEREIEIRRRFGGRFSYTPQEGEGLGERMEGAFHACFAKGFAATLLIGSDFPDLAAEVVEQAFQALENGQDAVVGPAFDGGYYLIGFRSAAFDPAVFKEMPWGENTVFEKTVNRLRDRGYRVHRAPVWHDIDTENDLADLQARHRNGAFSRSRTLAFLRKRKGGAMSRFCLFYLIVMMVGCSGTRPSPLGVTAGRLSACPASPNCVSSQSPDKEHLVEPLRYKGTAEQARKLLIEALLGMKRVRIVTDGERYLHAEFTSALFRFVDDVEFLLDEGAKTIHVRSASRVGYSDLGVNRRRVEEIRSRFYALGPPFP